VHVKWAPDGRSVLAGGGESGALSHWDVVTGRRDKTVELGRPVLGLSWRPDGRTAAVVAQGLALKLWDAGKNKVLRDLGAADDGFQSAAWSPDGTTLAAVTARETRLYDGETGKVVRTLAVTGAPVAWRRDGKQLLLLSDAVKYVDAGGGAVLKAVAVPGARTFAETPNGARLVTTSDTALAVHDAATGKEVHRFDIGGSLPPWWWPGRPLVTGVGTPTLTLWATATGTRLAALEGHTASVSAVTFAPGGKVLATASYDKTVRLWDAATGKPQRTFAEHPAAVLAVAFAANGKLVASAGADKQVLVWESATGKVLHRLNGHPADVTALAWAPGSAALLAAAGHEGTVRLWNVGQAKAVKLKGVNEMVSLAWSPDGKWLAGGQADHRLVIWQATTAKVLHVLEEPGSPPQVSALAWSPSGFVLAAGRGNHTMQLWDPRTGKKYHSLQTMAPVQHVAWTPGSSTVVASNQDRTARFFDAATGQLRGVFLAEDKQILAVNYDGYYRAPDGEAELVCVVQTYKTQDTYLPLEFTAKYRWKNVPSKVVLTGR
jgi:WD40 repeat protein